LRESHYEYDFSKVVVISTNGIRTARREIDYMITLTDSRDKTSSWEINSHSASPEMFPPSMEPEDSLRSSQEPAKGSCPEPHESNPQLPTLFL